MGLRIIHVADFHLGNRFVGLEGENVEEQRRADMFRNLDIIASHAVEKNVDLVLISGDIFHKPTPSPIDFVKFSEFVGRLVRNNIYVVAIAGNHDKPKIANMSTPIEGLIRAGVPRFYFFRTIPESPLMLDINGKKTCIVPIPYVDPNVLRASGIGLSYERFLEREILRLRRKAERMDPQYKILMAHVMLSEAKVTKIPSLYIREVKIGSSALREEFFDYVALGHVHRPQRIGERIFYSGSIERMAFDEEHEKKSFIIAELSEGKANVSMVELPCRPMLTKRLRIETGSISEFIEIIRGLEGIEPGSLLRLIITVRRTTWSTLEKAHPKVREILLLEKKVLGFVIKNSYVDEKAPTILYREARLNLRAEILRFIDSLRIEENVKKRAKMLAEEIMDEVGIA